MIQTKSLMEQLRNHDWYYSYSDDHRVWKRGQANAKRLQALLADFRCPYSMNDLRKAVQEMVFEDFVEEDGYWYRQPRKYKNVAGTRREDLMYRADQVQILAWIEAQDRSWNR